MRVRPNRYVYEFAIPTSLGNSDQVNCSHWAVSLLTLTIPILHRLATEMHFQILHGGRARCHPVFPRDVAGLSHTFTQWLFCEQSLRQVELRLYSAV